MEITVRTIQGRHLLAPSSELRQIIVGVLARAQEQHPVRLCAIADLSSHYHILLEADDAEQMAKFMQLVGASLAKGTGRVVGWAGTMWAAL